MSMAPFYGIPGKVSTLVSRLTSARASNLDNLNATVSSRAPSSTALSNATWTNAKAAFLDAAISGRASDADMATLLSRVPASNILSSALVRSANVVTACDGTDNIQVALGATFNVSRTIVQVTGPYRVGVGPVGEPEFAHTLWAWESSANSIYVKFFDSSGADLNVLSSRSVRVVALEFD